MMKFQFDPELEHQTKPIEAAVRLFEDAGFIDFEWYEAVALGVVGNSLSLSEEEILANLQAVQQDTGLQNGRTLPVTDSLDSLDFSVEMETGTGKTYVYLRTILELYLNYGLRKFIIVVPSVAIREGVMKTLEITREHFANLYDNVPYHYREYTSGNLSHVKDFCASNSLEIMVMTLDSFNKDTNIFNRPTDRMMGRKPINLVRKVRPVLILDEPQNMESEIAQAALSSLNPLFRLRYSASHRTLYNLIYRLTPIDAYNLRLVKQIEVASVVQDHNHNSAYVKCIKIQSTKTAVTAKLKIFVRQSLGPVPKTRTVRQGDNLREISQIDAYEGYVVDRLDAGYGEIRFLNGITLTEGAEIGPDYEAIARVQIGHTIEEHFRKAYQLRPKGIKVISLFFIDKVSNYTDKSGYIRRIFEEGFERIKTIDAPWAKYYKDTEPSLVQGSYFSQYRSKKRMEMDQDAYELIMRDKERLLSQEEAVEFVFSHSALREGWDSPNIFQICTLNRTISTIKKRQEIGRGMRLAVNQTGTRIHDKQVNILTVIANESYREYVGQLQTEYMEEGGTEEQPPKPRNRRKRRMVKLRKRNELDPEFEDFWEQVSRRTRFRVNIDSNKLVEACVDALRDLTISPMRIHVERGRILEIQKHGVFTTRLLGQGVVDIVTSLSVPNVGALIAEETGLTRKTVRLILEKTGSLGKVFSNPAAFVQSTIQIINKTKRGCLVDGVQYIALDEGYEMSLFEDFEAYEDNLIPIKKSIYNQLVYDAETEKDFALALEQMEEVKMFVKLPSWFIVPTPIGSYNPDWAILLHIQDEFGNLKEKLYLVRETKSTYDSLQRRGIENLKIQCARCHFDSVDVNFDVETSAWDFLRRIHSRYRD